MRNAVLVAFALLAVVCLLPGIGLAWEHPDGNLLVFGDYGQRAAAGAVPYRDFGVEYPPGALPTLILPALLPWSYATSFKLEAAVLAAATIPLVALLLLRLGRSKVHLYAGTAFVPLALLAFGGIALQRFDLLPALLVLAALLLLLEDRPRAAFAAIAVGALTKLYPAVLAPLAFAYVWRTRGRREAVVDTAIAAAIGVAVLLPFAALAHVGLYNSFAGQANRHLQLETLGSSALLLVHLMGGFVPHVVYDAGAETLIGQVPDRVATGHTLLEAATLTAIWIAFSLARRPSPEAVVEASVAAVAAFAILGKVLSPQFLLWLVPLVVLLARRRAVAAGALLLAALALSHAIYPPLYEELKRLEPGPIWLLAIRNAILVALLWVLVVPTLRRLRPAR